MNRRALLLYCFCLSGLLGLSVAHANEEKLKATEIRDLRYGETLFNYFQQKYFSAITSLMVADVRDPIQVQGEDPELLLGGLYLAYGMHNDASNLFQKLLSSETLPSTHDKAWYYIAKLRYLKGYTLPAEDALSKIKDTLPDEREAERLHMLANVHMKQKNYTKAIEVLKNFSGSSEWEAYAQFNLGVALVKAGQLDEGIQYLNEVSSLDPFSISHELNALRDKAALALGFTYMRANRPIDAEQQFKRVRLTGPLSNKALLGLGWSYTNQEKYQQALSPWLELQNRTPLATTVQESMIAIPFTIEKLDKKRLAMQYYQKAIVAYADEINRLEDVMVAVQRGELIEAMRPANIEDETSLPLNTFGLPKSVTAPYLNQMMATNTFQEAYKNYQSLLHLRYVLKHWWSQLPAYELILTERRDAYYKKLPQVAGNERLKGIADMQKKRDDLAAEIKRIQDENDGFALVTEDEEEKVLLIKKIEKKLAQLSKTEDMSDENEKLRLLKGILEFKLQSEFVPRLWNAQRELIELDRALVQTRNGKRLLVRAANQAPKFFEGYDQKIANSKVKIKALLAKLDQSIKLQEQYITRIAQDGLIKRRQILENYHVRARFGIARLYDSLILEKDKKAAQATSANQPESTGGESPAKEAAIESPAGAGQTDAKPAANDVTSGGETTVIEQSAPATDEPSVQTEPVRDNETGAQDTQAPEAQTQPAQSAPATDESPVQTEQTGAQDTQTPEAQTQPAQSAEPTPTKPSSPDTLQESTDMPAAPELKPENNSVPAAPQPIEEDLTGATPATGGQNEN